jgi:hypothetical protein
MAKNISITHKHSATAGNKPTTLVKGELAVNSADKSIYTFDGTNIIELERDIFRSAAAPTLPATGDVWYSTTNSTYQTWDGTNWIPLIYAGPYSLPATVTSTVGFSGGAGTLASPYVYASTFVRKVGCEMEFLDNIKITGLQPNQLVELQDLNAAANAGRFILSNGVTSAAGELSVSVFVTDAPKSVSGTSYTLSLTLGSVTTYIRLIVQLLAEFPQTVNYPTNTLSVSTAWVKPNATLTASNCILISTDNVTFGTGPLAVEQGKMLYTKWNGSPMSGTCIDAANGTTITGLITDSFGATSTGSLVIDKIPAPFVFNDITGVPLTSVQTSNIVNISGINSYIYPTTTGVGDMSIDGGAWVVGPAAASATVYGIDGSVLQVRRTSSAAYSTAVTLPVTISGISDTFSVTTTANTPGVATPVITTPVADSTGMSKTLTITSSAYTAINGALAHASSDWELYSDAAGTTLVTSSMASATNLTTWSPTGLLDETKYWVRVKHRSANPLDSAWSPLSPFTTEKIVLNLEISADYFGLIPSTNVTKNFVLSKLANEAIIAHFALDDTGDRPVFITPATGTSYISNLRSDTSGPVHYDTTGDGIIDSGSNIGSALTALPSYKKITGAGQTIAMTTVGSTGAIDIKLSGGSINDSVLFIKVPASFITAPKQIVASSIIAVGTLENTTLTFVAPFTGYYIAFLSIDISTGGPIAGTAFPLLDANYYPKITAFDNTAAAALTTGTNLPLVITNNYSSVGGLIMHQVMFKATAGNNISVNLTKPTNAIKHAGRFFTVVGFNA